MRNGIGKNITFAVTFVVTLSIIYQSNMNESVDAYNERNYDATFRQRHESALVQRQSFHDVSDETGDGNIKTVKVIDYVDKVLQPNGEQDRESVPLILPFRSSDQRLGSQAIDPCGSGGNHTPCRVEGSVGRSFL